MIIITIIIITLFSERLLLSFTLLYTYTRKSYLKKAFVNKHDIINHTQTKLIIHCIKMILSGCNNVKLQQLKNEFDDVVDDDHSELMYSK